MMTTSELPARALRAWDFTRRFQKFLLVGGVGLAVNQGFLAAFHDWLNYPVTVASPVAIFISMIVTFMLNERWTWHDRGTGSILQRLATYVPINTVGLFINWGLLTFLVQEFGVHYLIANLIGAGVAAIWNFCMNHAITWRDEVETPRRFVSRRHSQI